jgi:hypothetical protein
MAKKRKKEKVEEGYEFKMPEFDEEEYIRKEVRDSKALFVTFGYAVLIGFVSFGLSFLDIALAVLVGFIAIVFLRHLYPLVKVDTTKLEKKQWAGNIIMYLFAWLAIWILLTNPPFSDFASPTIKEDGIYFGTDGNWTKLNDTNGYKLNFTLDVSINVTIVDNVEVDEDTITIIIKEQDGDVFIEKERGPMNRITKNKYVYVVSNMRQRFHEYTITVKDVNGHEASLSGYFEVN